MFSRSQHSFRAPSAVVLALALAALACQPAGSRGRATTVAPTEAVTAVPVVTLIDAATGTPPPPADTATAPALDTPTPAASATALPPPTATSTVPMINDVLPGFVRGSTGGLGAGDDLVRVEIDLAHFPDAICNDGTGAIFYVRRYTNEADAGKWQIHLQGGGSCKLGQECAERWTSTDSNYGADKMSTHQTRPSIRGTGITSPDRANQFSGWNQVLVYYCSSDTWAGTARDTVMTGTDPFSNPITFRIHFMGAFIVDAVIATLQRQPDGLPLTYRSGSLQTMPDLDDASLVLFTGTSGGGNGVTNNADHVGELLRQSNTHCTGDAECPLQYLAVIDAAYGADLSGLDFAAGKTCQSTPPLCSYQAFMQAEWDYLAQTWGKRGDQSCVTWHTANEPSTLWKCNDSRVVIHNHITTPFFVRADLQDNTVMGGYLDAGLTTREVYGQKVHDQLLSLADLDSVAAEGSAQGGPAALRPPGIFGPECGDHVGLTSNDAFFGVSINVNGRPYTFHDILWNWVTGQQPQVAVETFNPSHKGPGCP
jgi:hypothetical protein